MLYADNDENTINQRIKYVINMYLNIPDKTKRGKLLGNRLCGIDEISWKFAPSHKFEVQDTD